MRPIARTPALAGGRGSEGNSGGSCRGDDSTRPGRSVLDLLADGVELTVGELVEAGAGRSHIAVYGALLDHLRSGAVEVAGGTGTATRYRLAGGSAA